VKRLWLVGESLPLKEDGSVRRAVSANNLPATLVPLDPRHGVFPNLVMKPLFAAGHALAEKREDLLGQFFREMNCVVADESQRRFNLFNDRATKSKGGKSKVDRVVNEVSKTDIFSFRSDIRSRIDAFDVQKDLWLVFGHQTNFGLLWYSLNPAAADSLKRVDLGQFSESFLSAACEISPSINPENDVTMSGRIGILHRLCTGLDKAHDLRKILTRICPNDRGLLTQVCEFFRSVVPLLHNEGYQDGANATGNAQQHFVKRATGAANCGQLYWKIMGNAIATRLTGGFVD
jgi:hypothetical protein